MNKKTDPFPNAIDGRLSVSEYFGIFFRDIDGKAWLLTTVFSLIVLVDVIFRLGIFLPIENIDFGKSVVLLVFTPLLAFLITARLRQLPFASKSYSALARAVVCLGLFFVINF